MRTVLIVLSACTLAIFLGACEGGDEGKSIPRTVPPTSIGDAVAVPGLAPTEPKRKPIKGTGPIYEA